VRSGADQPSIWRAVNITAWDWLEKHDEFSEFGHGRLHAVLSIRNIGSKALHVLNSSVRRSVTFANRRNLDNIKQLLQNRPQLPRIPENGIRWHQAEGIIWPEFFFRR
jgi:diaminopimelate epimerase